MSDRDKGSQSNGRSRRAFLKASTAAVAASTLAIPRNVHAAGTDEIKIGLVGCGGRGTSAVGQLMETASKHGPIKLVAMADAFEDNVQMRHKALQRRYADRMDVPEERRFSGLGAYRKVMETDCDLVVLATSPGFRPIHFDAAVKAGKHVFMEKPVATDAAGVRRVLATGEEAKKKGLAVAVGLQRHHEDRYKKTIAKLQEGAIGDLILARVYWNSGGVWVRPRKPTQTEMEYQVRNWYYFDWLCGDHIVEQHIHNLDVINWLKGAYPVKAAGLGGRQFRTGMDHGEIFDHFAVEYTYEDGSKMMSQCRHIPNCAHNVSEHAHGTRGHANISSGNIYDAQGGKQWNYGRGGGGGHKQEQFDLIAALRAGEIPNEVEYGAKSTMTAILGRMATYSGKELTWDAAINSKADLGVKDFLSFDEIPPVTPDAIGRYKIPMPGVTKVV